MRIWSIHPKYLDSKGLVALWREGLLAQHVLDGKTKGYKNHPQLFRFKETDNPTKTINQYLSIIYQEAKDRGYNFNQAKIDWNFSSIFIFVTQSQIDYEAMHLIKKLKDRDWEKYNELKKITHFEPHPLFKIREGGIEKWEII